MNETNKKPFTLETMNQFIVKINQAQTLEEIFKVGAELTGYEMDSFGYKVAVSKVYAARKKELIHQKLKNNDSAFTVLFYGFVECAKARKNNSKIHWDDVAKRYARLTHYMKECGIISNHEYSVLMQKYEEATGRPVGNGNGNGGNGNSYGKDDTDEEVPF